MLVSFSHNKSIIKGNGLQCQGLNDTNLAQFDMICIDLVEMWWFGVFNNPNAQCKNPPPKTFRSVSFLANTRAFVHEFHITLDA